MAYIFLIGGLVLLLLGGEWLVKGAVDLALKLNISTLVVGMTVVSFATSAPELLVSVGAATKGYTDISFANVIGSNLANIALILGVTVIIFPMKVKKRTYKIDYWIMMFATLLLMAFVYFDSRLTAWEAGLLFFFLLLYNISQIRSAQKAAKAEKEEEVSQEENDKEEPKNKLWVMIAYLVVGVVALKFGSKLLVDGAVIIAKHWGVSERIIGITIISIGTSLPELAASLVASFKGEQELSLGNLIGSNIFNILAVLGITGMIIDLPIDNEALLNFDFPYLIGTCLLLFLFIAVLGKGKISRWQGVVMLTVYVSYLYIIL